MENLNKKLNIYMQYFYVIKQKLMIMRIRAHTHTKHRF